MEIVTSWESKIPSLTWSFFAKLFLWLKITSTTANFTNSNCAGSWLSKMLWRPQQNHKQHTSAFLNYKMILKKLEKCFLSDFNLFTLQISCGRNRQLPSNFRMLRSILHNTLTLKYLSSQDPKVFIISLVLQSFSLHVSTMNLVQVSLCHSYESQKYFIKQEVRR